MKTILIEEPGKVVIKEQEKPIRKPGEVLLKILYIVGILLSSFLSGVI